jgi:hypothetical protein
MTRLSSQFLTKYSKKASPGANGLKKMDEADLSHARWVVEQSSADGGEQVESNGKRNIGIAVTLRDIFASLHNATSL